VVEETREALQEVIARGALYKLLSLAFSPPDPPILAFLKDGFVGRLKEALTVLPPASWQDLTGLGEAVAGLEALEGEYNRLFRTGLAATPYETEYDPIPALRKGQTLADLLGFYQAFGLKTSERVKELPDHVAVELEFMGLLLLKEAYALQEGWRGEAGICRDAERAFLEDHLGRWIFSFCEQVGEVTQAPFYRACAGFLKGFLGEELQRFGLDPLLGKRAAGPPAEDFTCPFARACGAGGNDGAMGES